MTDNSEKMRRTASADMQKNFEAIYIENPMTIDTARRATAQFMVDEGYISAWNKKLNSWEMAGQDKLKGNQRRIFLSHLNLQYSKLITEKLDPLSRVFVRSYNKNEKGISWKFPECLLWNFDFKGVSQGVYACIDGVPRSGKTSFACTLMPMFNDIGIEVITNIAIDNKPSYIHVRKKLSEVVSLMNKLDKWVLILDETATYVDKKRALSVGNIDFENLARFIGKMGGRLIMITHDFDKDIPTRLQDWTTERFTKQKKDRMRVILSGDKFKMFDIVKHIPDADIQFSTEDITSLKFDISIRKLLEDVQEGDSVDQALKKQEKYKHDKKAPTKKEMIINLAKKGLGTKDIAERLDTDLSYVSQVKRKM
jgi:hypothetical protein